MSWIPVGADQWGRRRDTAEGSEIPQHLWTAGVILRTVFIVSLVVVILHVSMPQSETLWTIYDTPGDLLRLVLGLAACAWIGIQLFAVPKDLQAFRTWLYLGATAVPFVLLCVVALW